MKSVRIFKKYLIIVMVVGIMRNITVTTATEKDRNQLFDYFKHYEINKLIEQRVMCYTSHNVTLIAKHQGTIVGVLQ